jgi:hypothetical protein
MGGRGRSQDNSSIITVTQNAFNYATHYHISAYNTIYTQKAAT